MSQSEDDLLNPVEENVPADGEDTYVDVQNNPHSRSRYFWGQSHAAACPAFKEEHKAKVTYFISQQETGRQHGRKHWQFYFEVDAPVTVPTVRSWLVDTNSVWVAIRQPTCNSQDCYDYVVKDADGEATRVEFGVMSDGRRRKARADTASHSSNNTSLEYTAALDDIAKGASYAETMVKYPRICVKYGPGLQRLRLNFLRTKEPINEAPSVKVLYGPPGTGKTYGVYKEISEKWKNNVYWLKSTVDGRLWFDGYDGQECLVIDDFEGNMRIDDFLHLTDRYASNFEWEVKGSMTKVFFKRILITSNSNPRWWFTKWPKVKQDACMRRLTETYNYSFVRVTQNGPIGMPVVDCPRFGSGGDMRPAPDMQGDQRPRAEASGHPHSRRALEDFF